LITMLTTYLLLSVLTTKNSFYLKKREPKGSQIL